MRRNPTTANSDKPSELRSSSLRIVIVDESPVRAAILEEGLHEAGYKHVQRIAETERLLGRIYEIDPDVILIGLENPSRDVLEQMFQMSRAVKRPIAMFVDQSDSAAIQAAVDAGVSAYIVDGLKKERVTSILDLCISRFNAFSRLQNELERAKDALEERKIIDRAKGALMKAKNLNEEEAYTLATQDRDERKQKDHRDRAIRAHRSGVVQMSARRLRIGFIPLIDAASLVVAVDHGFAAEQGLSIELVREVSWSNVRDKLNIGLFDAAHLLSPVAIASSLGLGHVRVSIISPFNLALNGNAITLSPWLFEALADAADGDIAHPLVSARALAKIISKRKAQGAELLNFGMTFPFSNHNYQLRFWMAAGGVDPDEDVRLVVLPPPYMVDSLAKGQVDGFCVGAPWNSVAVASGFGRILHFGCTIMARASEKVLAVREQWAMTNPDTLAALLRTLTDAGNFIGDDANQRTVATTLSRRFNVDADIIARTLAGELKLSIDGAAKTDRRYLMVRGPDANRPDPVQAAWLYAQMARWRGAPLSNDMRVAALAVFRSDLYDAAIGAAPCASQPIDGVGAFVGPLFNADDVTEHVSRWRGKNERAIPMRVVR